MARCITFGAQFDHEGEVPESYVTTARDKKAGLKFLKKALRKHGRAKEIVTDKLRSYGAAYAKSAPTHGRKSAVGSTIELRIHTYHSDEENVLSSGFGGCGVFRNSSL